MRSNPEHIEPRTPPPAHPRARLGLARFFHGRAGPVVEPALSAELYSSDQMELYGVVLANRHRVSSRPAANSLLERLAENAAVLADAGRMFTEAVHAGQRVTPAGEWLLDNAYLIEEQIHAARRDLPSRYSRELPRLLEGTSAGLPRVYDIALKTIAHSDGRVDRESLGRFVAAYQTVTQLKLGELWAIPIMLRLGLIENLRRVAIRVVADWNDRNLAGTWADRMSELAANDPKSVVLAVADMARSSPPMGSAFVAELARRLQGQGPALALGLTWIEQTLSESGTTIERLVHLEAQQQASGQVSIGNSIGSLRLLSGMNWRDFVEAMSGVEHVLRQDPSGIYASMDFSTRDHYRHVVEEMARHCTHGERELARAAIALAARAGVGDGRSESGLRGHVGYYLIGAGLAELERAVDMPRTLLGSMRTALRRVPLALYLGPVAILIVLLLLPAVHFMRASGIPDWESDFLAPVALLAASQLALALMNWMVGITVQPQMLPRLDYSRGLPAQARTLVVVPAMLGSAHDIDELVDALEVRFLGNRDAHLHFALLTDFVDAASQALDTDAGLLEHARERIERLNAAYSDPRVDRFFLFHRPRRLNPVDHVWMGYERKRGKLSALNGLLRGADGSDFSLVVGRTDILGSVRYVITLDTDTQLPRDAARCFVGAMSHPLNRPVLDPTTKCVVGGHAILQPRVGISLPHARRSRYARMFGSEAGIDPYTRTVSDVYQDLFGEGSFIGKGIYDVDAFESAVGGRFAENSILSHDLLEGCYARCGLISDVQLYEEYPSRYRADLSRRHRWLRGDWQLLPWLFPYPRTGEARRERNPLSLLSRWKILDNLRRSLEPVALLVLLVAGWFGTAHVATWTALVLGVIFLPPFLATHVSLLRVPQDVGPAAHLRSTLRAAQQEAWRAALAVAWLPHGTQISLDAIVRTLWRLGMSRRQLLQWRPSQAAESVGDGTLGRSYREMAIGPLVACLLALGLGVSRPHALAVAAPVLLLWLSSPLLAWWTGLPAAQAEYVPSAGERRFLRRIARKTWAYFEAHVDGLENWLPPDNIQEAPIQVIAHRTSPTNMGLALLADLAAYDLGILGPARLLDRTALALRSMQRLARYHGHFYNWYDTVTLQALPPRYISSVDSGNLAGHLLTLRQGLLGLLDAPLFDARQLQGLDDTCTLLIEASAGQSLLAFRTALDLALGAPPGNMADAWSTMQALSAAAARIEVDGEPGTDALFWLAALRAQCRDASAGLLPFAGHAAAVGFPTLRQLSADPTGAADPAQSHAAGLQLAIADMVEQVASLATMDFGFLYDTQRDLLTIGYDVDERRVDVGAYDLLASEARLGSFVAIAQEQLPQESWFALGRLLTYSAGSPVLLSWSGSMFEYLMPLLVMPSYPGTLLDATCAAAVARQIEYGRQLGLPWGVSESGYNSLDVNFNYQYRAFGVPGLGLKRGLGEERVVAPYASALALMVAPAAACANLQRLAAAGVEGRYGMYEAVDYTPARLTRAQGSAIVRSYMAHHQAMSLLAIDSLLRRQPMQHRFAADPSLRATMLLLQERVPKAATEYLHANAALEPQGVPRNAVATLRVLDDPDRARPAVQLLSNGRYHVMLSGAGSGYSRVGEMSVTRWSEDISRDAMGSFAYLRDVASGQFWSSTHQPTLARVDFSEVVFSDARAEFRVRQRDFDAHTEIVVSPEDDIELRRMRVTNRSGVRRTIEITSYAEVVLAPALADALHPAFSKLFVQTELVPALQAVVCTRRRRAADEAPAWMCQALAVHDADIDEISYETDRLAFIGRGRSLVHPRVMDGDAPSRLSNRAGCVLDPIVAIRCRITLAPEQSALIDLVMGVGTSREQCLQLIEKYRDRHLADRVFDLAWTHSQVMLRQLNARQADAQIYEEMAGSILFAHASMRAEEGLLRANQRGPSGLWGQAISGDLPIVLVHIRDEGHIELVRQLVQAHAYWRLKGLAVDLVIWNEDQAGYRQSLQDQIMSLIASGVEASLIDRHGGIFVRALQQIGAEDRVLVQAAARLVLTGGRGTLAEQIRRRRPQRQPDAFVPSLAHSPAAPRAATRAEPALLQANPYGGFQLDGSEYVVRLDPGHATPAPWVNVLANASFGTVVSESGGAYTWNRNAHEFRLTPWRNDPVSDPSGEAMYLRDEQSGHCWSPTALPRRGEGRYTCRHGFGYSVFEHCEDGISSELWVFVAIDEEVKYWVLKLRNDSGRARRLSATGYVEWVLGDLRERTAMHVVTEVDRATGALFARNSCTMDFPGRVAFFDVGHASRQVTGDRTEFIGRNGTLSDPAALRNARLSGRVGAGLDPCAAMQVGLELDMGEQREVAFLLGAADTEKAASELVQRCRGALQAAASLQAVRDSWDKVLGAVRVRTPDPAVDLLANGWLMYQVVSCRFLARSGYYQSGGAIGFRDQLQDGMAMLHVLPQLVREHLLLCAGHQFPEGDVQHWWHPPQDRGVRTRCSDDYLWLALAASRYVEVTGDRGVLDEPCGYLEAKALAPGAEADYALPAHSELSETLYRHCVRAIEHAATRGVHGLPLIGSGDWNDGMNRVGEQGRGESVWLGFFLHEVLQRFAVTAGLHDDADFAARCRAQAADLRAALDRHGWDGDWFLRALYDDGTPLGSASGGECQIDSIAQSWAVLSGAASAVRQRQGMEALDRRLVRRAEGVVCLLDPPFDQGTRDPGYIKGYPSGVRENGGQYTHAAIWAAMAFARLGDPQRAWELLRIIHPINHGVGAEAIERYKLEPYVVAADVYAAQPHTGRGGWSWYTGSAGWMYRLILESLLGLQREGPCLRVEPVIPPDWAGFEMTYRFGDALYHIHVTQVDSGRELRLDGIVLEDGLIELVDSKAEHRVDLRLGRYVPAGAAA